MQRTALRAAVDAARWAATGEMEETLLAGMLLSAGIVLAVSTLAHAADYSARTHFYAVEYLKPSAALEDLTV